MMSTLLCARTELVVKYKFPACRQLREVMSPVGSPGMSWIFAESQKSTTPRTPSGPRLAVQAAGPATRPDEAGVTFPRRDTLPGITSGQRFPMNVNKVDSNPFAVAS